MTIFHVSTWHLTLHFPKGKTSKQNLYPLLPILQLLQMCLHERFACTPQPPLTFNSAEQRMLPVQDMDTGAGDAGPVQLPPGKQVMTQHVVLPPNVLQMLQEHTAFLHQQGKPPCHRPSLIIMLAQQRYCCSCKCTRPECSLSHICLSQRQSTSGCEGHASPTCCECL